MEKIRILQVIGGLNIGGSQSMIINFYKKIDRSRMQFDFIIDKPDEIYYKQLIESLGGKVYIMPGFNGLNFHKVKKAWKLFFSEHPEYKILHSHVRSYASLYIPIAKKFGLKTIIHSHSTSNGSGIASVYKKILQFPLRYQADYFFGCSKESGRWLFGKKVIFSKNFFVLKNSVDLEKYTNLDDKKKYYNEFGLNENEKIFVHVGRFHIAKNHMFLLDLFKSILNIWPDSKLLLVGDGELRGKIQEKIIKLNIEKNVILAGNRNDVHGILQIANCFLFPSSWEGLPITVVEAQAAGINCLISDRITDEVNVSSLVHKISIDKGIDPWISYLKKINFQRINVEEDLIKAGFDISSSAKWLENFYYNLV